jgi:hypothetical protein
MTLRITAPGVGLPIPQFQYPSQVYGASVDVPVNQIGLAGGDALAIPDGSNDYLIDPGAYSVVQYLDPVMGIWRGYNTGRGPIVHIPSDGLTRRIANLTGCAVAASVANGGTSYSQATCSLTASAGGSTWQPIVGGSLSVSTINNPGANYTMPPIVLIPGPPPLSANGVGGIPANAYAVLTGTTVSAVSLVNLGAGYQSAPTAVLVPNPSDPNLGSITNATITLILVAANQSKITGALCTNNGAPLATISSFSLTAAGGAGSGATITPQVLQTVVSASVVAGGAGWGTATAPAKVLSVGGISTAGEAIANPVGSLTGLRVRDVNALGTCNAGGTITAVTISDGGLFLNVPSAAVSSGGTLPTTLASITFATGSATDTVFMTPL